MRLLMLSLPHIGINSTKSCKRRVLTRWMFYLLFSIHMKSVGGYITKLLIVSLLINLVVYFRSARYFWLIDGNHGTGITIMLSPLILFQFVLSTISYININKKRRSISLLSFFSFMAFRLIYIIWLIIYFDIGFEYLYDIFHNYSDIKLTFTPLLFLVWLPYTLCMIISYIFFRRFCRRELGE